MGERYAALSEVALLNKHGSVPDSVLVKNSKVRSRCGFHLFSLLVLVCLLVFSSYPGVHRSVSYGLPCVSRLTGQTVKKNRSGFGGSAANQQVDSVLARRERHA